MQVKASITHTVYFEVQDGTSIESIRAEALGAIDTGYTEEETSLGTPEGLVSTILETSVVGTMLRESVEIQVSKVE